VIRLFDENDALEAARIWHRSGLDEYDYLPSFQQLTESKALDIFLGVIHASCEIWIEESTQGLRGFVALKGSYIDRLYVHPDYQRLGVGTALLAQAKRLAPQGLELHTHQQNQRARSFYEKFGFLAVKFGISPAPECVPDVEYHWRPAEGATFGDQSVLENS
jgi:ribosomal protein S18 acetylase RimI-like enzyme